MPQIVNHALAAGDEAADRGERLGEGAGDDVDLVGEVEVGGGAFAVGAEDAERVRVVEGEGGAVFPGGAEQAGDVGDVAFHGVDAVDDDHRAAAALQPVHAP